MAENTPFGILKIDLDTLRFFPRRVSWIEVAEVGRFDDRFGAVNATVGAIMDVGHDHVELNTDDRKPTLDELVAWAWLIRPDRGKELRQIASPDMREAIDYYEEGKE